MKMKTKNILPDLFRYVESQDTKIAKRIANWLDKDCLASVAIYDTIFWLETNNTNDYIPSYVFKYIKRWCNKYCRI